MALAAAEAFVRRFAPDDVRAAIRWLASRDYKLVRSEIGTSDWAALLVFAGRAEVHIGVDRAQWHMEIAFTQGDPPIQYDLLVAAQRGQNYWDCFPDAGTHSPAPTRQLPPGLSWRETLPEVLGWIGEDDVAQAVARAADQRYVVMWPDSNKAKKLRREWRAQALPTPDQQ